MIKKISVLPDGVVLKIWFENMESPRFVDILALPLIGTDNQIITDKDFITSFKIVEKIPTWGGLALMTPEDLLAHSTEDWPKYVTHASLLKDRRWTEKLIEIYLHPPCKLATNPFNRRANPMRLYRLGKVEVMESQKEFKEYILRKESSRKILSEKALIRAELARKELADKVSKITITIPRLAKDVLLQRACFHYNQLWSNRENYDKQAEITADEVFLNRITVNYLRHDETKYEEQLRFIFGKVGVREAYAVLKNLILTKIAEAYPFLLEECMHQVAVEED